MEQKEQSITIKIAGKDYALKVNSAEMEQLMRIAAENINQRLSAYDAKFPDKTLADKLAFVTLSETVSRLSYQKKLVAVGEEMKRMLGQTDQYLENIEKNSR